MDIEDVLFNVVFPSEHLEAYVAGKTLTILVQVSIHVPAQATTVVERFLANTTPVSRNWWIEDLLCLLL